MCGGYWVNLVLINEGFSRVFDVEGDFLASWRYRSVMINDLRIWWITTLPPRHLDHSRRVRIRVLMYHALNTIFNCTNVQSSARLYRHSLGNCGCFKDYLFVCLCVCMSVPIYDISVIVGRMLMKLDGNLNFVRLIGSKFHKNQFGHSWFFFFCF